MMTTSTAPTKPFANATHHAGCFWWVDLTTPDPAAAKAFYGELFGWTYDDSPVGNGAVYSMAKLDGLDVCAMNGQRAEQAGMPPMWTAYLTVDDVDAVTARVADLGGAVLAEPFDVMDVGRMSMIQDVSGAAVALWQAITHPGAQAVNQPGALTWTELIARGEPEAVTGFWAELMGWTTMSSPMPDGGQYTTFLHDGHPAAGMLQMPEDMAIDVPSAWMVYFAVADLDASLAALSRLGGVVHITPTRAPEVGMFAMVQDPQGGMFYLLQLDEWPEER